MDNQNLTNQVPVSGTAPVVPSVPEDITPVETTSNLVPPITTPETNMASVTPTPWVPQETPSISTSSNVGGTLSTPEPEIPQKPKRRVLPIITGIAAFFLVVGVAGAAYYVSNQLSTRQAVAPNAPTSKPAAATPTINRGTGCSGHCGNCSEGEKGSGTCYDGQVCCVAIGGGGGVGGVGVCYNADGSLKKAGYNNACGSQCCSSTAEKCCTEGCKPKDYVCGSGGGGGGGGTVTPVNGDWSTWSTCSATACGTPGTKTKTCNKPAPANGGAECTRADGTKTTPTNRTETASCSAAACPAGACVNVDIYKKVNGAYGTTPLSTAELKELVVGDTLKLTITASLNGLRGRFYIEGPNPTGNAIAGTPNSTNTKLISYEYTISAPGSYKFSGQVSTLP